MPKQKKTVNKSEFVRANPKLTAAEVVAKAKAAGIKIAPNYIYVIRSKKNGEAKTTKTGKSLKFNKGKRVIETNPPVSNGAQATSLFEKRAADFESLVRDIGLVHAAELLSVLQST